MRRSLFEEWRQEPQKQRIKPNIFAQAARFSVLNAVYIAVTAGVLVLLALYPVVKNLSNHAPLLFLNEEQVGQNWQRLQSDFPGIEYLQTLTLANEDQEKLRDARDALLEKLSTRSDLFQSVLSPGVGNFYDSYGIYYHQPAEIDARVSYALSLKALFQAIAVAPNAASLATLVNEVSASIEQGRDPQGLDALFSEAAVSLKDLMSGDEHHADWLKISGLETTEGQPGNIIVLWPKLGRGQEANEFINAAVQAAQEDGKTRISVEKLDTKTPKRLFPNLSNLPVVAAMAAILVILVFYAMLGMFRLVFIAAIPALIGTVGTAAFAAVLVPTSWKSFWPVASSILATGLIMGLRFAWACLDPLSKNRNSATALMLAAQNNGQSLLRIGVICVVPWLAWIALFDHNLIAAIPLIVVGFALCFLATALLQPALFSILNTAWQWPAAEWLEAIFDPYKIARFWQKVQPILRTAVFPLLALSLWAATPHFQSSTTLEKQAHFANVIVSDNKAAEQTIERLKVVPEAGSVRWIGAFLPDEVEAKQLVLSQLKGFFPRIDPQQHSALDDLHDQIESLRTALANIATAKNVRPELASAANEFRQSLELFSNTGTDDELLKLENRLFGGFNRMADKADVWANLAPPEISNLDPNLRSMFAAQNGSLRLEVTPSKGTSTLDLTKALEVAGIAVADENLDTISRMSNFWRSAKLLAAALIILTFLGALAGLQNMGVAIAATLNCLASLATAVSLAAVLNVPAEPITLLSAASAIGIGFYLLMAHALEYRAPNYLQQLAQTWAPFLVLSASLAPFAALSELHSVREFQFFLSLCFFSTVFALIFKSSNALKDEDLPE